MPFWLVISLIVFSPLVYIDPLHANLATMLTSLFKDSLNEYAYAAEIAGLKYSLSSTAYGINVSWNKCAITRENRSSGFTTRSNTNRSVHSQKKARSLKFWI